MVRGMHATEPLGNGSDATDEWGKFAFSIKDTARILAVSERMVRYLVADGQLESFKVGVARRVHGASLRDYIRRHTEPRAAS